MAESLGLLLLHKTLHSTVGILVQRPTLATIAGKMGATKNKIPIISQCPGLAQSAAAQISHAGQWLAEQAYPVPLATHETPRGIASAAVAWRLEGIRSSTYGTIFD